MANTQNASFQMLVLPDRHHFYTALAFHISSYIFHISSILNTHQTCLSPPFPSFFSLVYLFIYLFPPFSSSSSSYNPFSPFLSFSSLFTSFPSTLVIYFIVSSPRVGGKSFIFFSFSSFSSSFHTCIFSFARGN